MTKFLDQTRERFLLAIASQLPAERFIELHFFHPIRQGGIESGVAVIAAYPESQPEIILADAPPADHESGSLVADARSGDDESRSLVADAPRDDMEENERPVIPSAEVPVIPSEEIPVIPSSEDAVIPSEARDLLFTAPDESGSLPDDPPDDAKRRYTVYSARYKLVLKGPDRGKWECAVVAEADAPLVTVESVVRGVQRRSGDAEEPERMSGDEARDYVLAATR